MVLIERWVPLLIALLLVLVATSQSVAPSAEHDLTLDEYLAQVRDWTPKIHKGELPIGLTKAEEATMAKRERRPDNAGSMEMKINATTTTTSPPSNPRFVPEWAPMQGVLIRFPFGLELPLIRAMSETVTIFCLVDARRKKLASKILFGAGIDPDAAVEWIIGPTDSYWTRDYGPWFVFTDDYGGPIDSDGGGGRLAIVNHSYNRPRPSDDAAPLKVANHMGIPYYDSGVVGTGGNFMVDGLGQAAATHIAYTENFSCQTHDDISVPLDACSTVDNALLNYYGIGVFHVVADPTSAYIDHIDCWGKYLNSTTILVRQVSPDHPQYMQIESVADYFRTNVTTTSNGDPWTMVRVMTDSDQPYTNSLILNDQVYVPIVGSAGDEAALQVYRDAMPGYNVSGWTGRWSSTDALHCRTRGIPKPPPAPKL